MADEEESENEVRDPGGEKGEDRPRIEGRGRWMSMKIILWMRVRGAHLSRWRMELIKLSPHLPRRR